MIALIKGAINAGRDPGTREEDSPFECCLIFIAFLSDATGLDGDLRQGQQWLFGIYRHQRWEAQIHCYYTILQ